MILVGSVAVALAVPAALADGDPASDVLYTRNVFLPYPAPGADAATALAAEVDAVYERNDRIRVAVIASPSDLGAVPSLFGKPSDYAKFLGLELGIVYVGPLLVVMPAGFGIYDGGRSTAAEERVLAGVPIQGASADELTRTAAAAVSQLIAADALRSKDILAPIAAALPSAGSRGRPMRLSYEASDDSGRTSAVLQVITGRARVLATFRRPLQPTAADRAYSVTWHVPATLADVAVKLCVTATDPSGNRSRRSCEPLTVV